jgi:DNA-binding CsgD family transcriptional regulator
MVAWARAARRFGRDALRRSDHRLVLERRWADAPSRIGRPVGEPSAAVRAAVGGSPRRRRLGLRTGRGDELSPAELRVLSYLPGDLRTDEIASERYVSVNTVRTHIRRIYAKLDAHTRHQAVARARDLGLLVRR